MHKGAVLPVVAKVFGHSARRQRYVVRRSRWLPVARAPCRIAGQHPPSCLPPTMATFRPIAAQATGAVAGDLAPRASAARPLRGLSPAVRIGLWLGGAVVGSVLWCLVLLLV